MENISVRIFLFYITYIIVLHSCFDYLIELDELDPTSLAPLMLEKLFSRSKHSAVAMKSAIKIINSRKSSILFFKGTI